MAPSKNDPAFRQVPRTSADYNNRIDPSFANAMGVAMQSLLDLFSPQYKAQDVNLPREGQQVDPRLLGLPARPEPTDISLPKRRPFNFQTNN